SGAKARAGPRAACARRARNAAPRRSQRNILRCRNSILILYRDWSDSKDVLDALETLCQIGLTNMKGGKKKPQAKPIRAKRPNSKPAKRQPLVPIPAALKR